MQIINEQEDGFSNLDLLAQQVVEGFITGLHQSPFHGFSVEFSEHRLYNAGESVKSIDWKLYAKTEKLFSKRYEEETNLRCQFVLDVSSSMYFPNGLNNKLRFSILAIAALIKLLRRQRDAFGLSIFTDHLLVSTDTKSTLSHQRYLFAELERVFKERVQNRKTDLTQILHQIAELVHKRSLIVLFSDMLQSYNAEAEIDRMFTALQHLKFNKHEVIIFNVSDKQKEIDFNFGNHRYEFIDLETGGRITTFTTDIKRQYASRIRDYYKALQLKCARYKIDLIDVDIQQNVDQVLEKYLIKRKRMG
ncbi:DUF58 domain-containing protein [Pedobacter deserti]|uniref:DUF58 domain-containing protein n=1 Tax=Pedobacter deserti TaxID=2817382 RepID=UPI00210F08EA|nr:DUF58 domain-containing protein [Pedobacter sp. SYSU D00382]